MAAGDRVVLFSDGVEEAFADPAQPSQAGLISQLQRLRPLGGEEMIFQLAAHIDQHRPTNARDDDITVVVMDVCAD